MGRFLKAEGRFFKYIAVTLTLGVLSCCLTGCGGEKSESGDIPDPYEGMVQVSLGYGTTSWTELLENVQASPFTADEFDILGTDRRVVYKGEDYVALQGIDVSEHQADISWQAVAANGIDFALIRAGYRGYSQGGIYFDEYFTENIEGALDAGLQVGVYLFSQAVNEKEAREEADFLIDAISDYNITLPLYYDWEPMDFEDSRSWDTDGETVTACANAFCEEVSAGGYRAGIYFYRSMGYFFYDLDELAQWEFWVAATGSYPDFYYEHTCWQYTDTGSVPGITGDVDRDLLFVKRQGN